MMIWKMIFMGKPGHLRRKLVLDENMRIVIEYPRLQFTERSLLFRGSMLWNDLPDELREKCNIGVYKRRPMTWMREQRMREPG